MLADQFKRRRNGEHSGFTLVEVLVVVAIIGVLVALSLSAMEVVKKAAPRAACASNLRQIGVLFSTYFAENDNIIPQRYNRQTKLGYERQLLHGKDTTEESISKVFICPAHKKLSFPRQVSYGMNWFYDNASTLTVTNMSRTILAGESDGSTGGRGSRRLDRNNQSPGVVAKVRHEGRANYLFFDGHVEALTFQETLEPLDMWGEDHGQHGPL